MKPSPSPVLLEFANAFMEYESEASETALKAREKDKPTSILFRLKLFRAEKYKSQTAFYVDTEDSEDEAKTLKNEVTQTFLLDLTKVLL